MKTKNNLFMKYLSLILFSFILIAGCGKKESANSKFLGTYSVSDRWTSSVAILGNGNLEYNLVIEPNGEDENSVLISNLNKTINNVKATVSGDSLIIPRQEAKSTTGATYDVLEYMGILKNNKLNLWFQYDDRKRENNVGLVFCIIEGTKISSPTEKK